MIRAVMFDMGGTLEDVYSDEISDKNTAEALYRVLQSHDIQVPYGAEELWAKVGPQITAYKKQSEITLRELKPEEIWVDWGFRTSRWIKRNWLPVPRRSPICGRPPTTTGRCVPVPPKCSRD